jgi:hypothetical protein
MTHRQTPIGIRWLKSKHEKVLKRLSNFLKFNKNKFENDFENILTSIIEK